MDVLIVDDSTLVRQRVVDLLAEAVPDAEVYEADSVSSAQTQLASRHVDALVLDLRLPDGSGLEVLRAAKLRLPGLTVIVLSNYADDFYRARCRQLGADFFFDKSQEFMRIVTTLQTLATALMFEDSQDAV